MKTVLIIPAGGAGQRFKSHVAKQYLLLDALPVLVHTLKVFQDSPVVDEIILVLPQDDVVHVRQDLIEKYGMSKVVAVVAGGRERQDSVKNGLDAIQGNAGLVIVHDAVRPFVTDQMIGRVVDAARACGAAATGVQVKDTVKATKDDRMIQSTVPRENLWLAQTPQAFRFDILKDAYRKAYEENFYGTDDAALVERTGQEVKMVEGSYDNIKITTREDMLIAEAFMKKRNTSGIRSGFGYDSHRFADDRKLVLGGVEIPCDRGLEGHSDADALIHAICDALLGAAGAGDIGRHFPDTDPQYKDISSMILLKNVKKILDGKGFRIENIDATVILEVPRLAPYADAIAANIARVLNISDECVNIKAKTNEGMGFTGRREGVAVFAVASLAGRMRNGAKT